MTNEGKKHDLELCLCNALRCPDRGEYGRCYTGDYAKCIYFRMYDKKIKEIEDNK